MRCRVYKIDGKKGTPWTGGGRTTRRGRSLLILQREHLHHRLDRGAGILVTSTERRCAVPRRGLSSSIVGREHLAFEEKRERV